MDKNKRKVTTIVTTLIAIVLLLISITYAYMSATKVTTKNSVQAGTLLINYEDDKLNTVNLSNIQPIYDKDIKTKANKISFKVNNTGTAKAYVDINITDINLPSELADLEFKWALYSGDEKISNGNFRNVLDNKLLLINNEEIESTKNKSYDLYIWISESELDQSDMMNKTFSAKITVVGHQNKQAELLSKVIKDNNEPSTQKPDFNKTSETDDGLIQDIDKDGETYYFRGAVEYNYLKIEGLTWPDDSETGYLIPGSKLLIVFPTKNEAENTCNSSYSQYGYQSIDECKNEIKEVGAQPGEYMLFRVVRINGDRTIRIIADGSIGKSSFNVPSNEEKYVGYTYNNSKPNIQDGDSSTIKEYLDNWYDENMTNYNKIFAYTRYCNDTTTGHINSSGYLYYGAYDRLDVDNNGANPQPTYICPNTDKLYGGEYDLKIGLLSADEVSFAGGKYNSINQNYYLFGKSGWRFLGSPNYFTGSNSSEFSINGYGGLGINNIKNENSVIPVLNLRADTPFIQGDGTKNSPYIVSVNN